MKMHAVKSTHKYSAYTHTHTHSFQKQSSGIMDKAMEWWEDFIIHTLLTTSHLLNAHILIFVSVAVCMKMYICTSTCIYEWIRLIP